MNCKDCKHWWPTDGSTVRGQCRIDPPKAFMVVAQTGPMTFTAWPGTNATQGCGKFEQKGESETWKKDPSVLV